MENWLRNPRVQGSGDAVLAALLRDQLGHPRVYGRRPSGRPKALGVALGLLSTVPVAWRARRPLTAFAIVLFANGACIYAAAPHEAAFQPFVALTPGNCTTWWRTTSMMVVQAGAAARVLAGDQPEVRKALVVIAETGRLTIDEMRTLLGVLRASPADAEPRKTGAGTRRQPGLADLGQLVHSVREAGLPVELRIDRGSAAGGAGTRGVGVPDRAGGADEHCPACRPASADVVVRYTASALELEITDTGSGPASGAGSEGAGHGLAGMRERAGMFGGSLTAGPASGGGFVVRASLPLPASSSVSSVAASACIRLVLADDQALVRAGFRLILEAEPDMRVAGEAGDGATALGVAPGRETRSRSDGHPHAGSSTALRRRGNWCRSCRVPGS